MIFATRLPKWSSTLRVGVRARISSTRRRIDNWISGAWGRFWHAIRSAIGRVYNGLYWCLDRYEHVEPLVIITELVLIISGLIVETDLLDIDLEDLFDLQLLLKHFKKLINPKDLLEICIFVVLGVIGVGRMLVVLRRRSLGYSYKEIGQLLDDKDIDDVYTRVRSAPWGSAPAGKSDSEGLTSYAGTIAKRSAAVLSLRTYYSPDKRWLARDQGSLLDWFTIFPAGLWRLVPEDKCEEAKSQAPANADSGYYSVIVPTTVASAKHICRGQKATDLAEVDPKIADAFGKQPIEVACSNPVEFLAYVQLHVPRYEGEQTADELLFAASIQHIVSLLHGIFGAAVNFRAKWNFVIFCEAANRLHGAVIERLGFLALAEKAHERSEEPTGPGKSYAGFPLLRLKVVNGQPCPDPKHPKAAQSKAYAEKFIQFLEDLTVIYRDRMEERAS